MGCLIGPGPGFVRKIYFTSPGVGIFPVCSKAVNKAEGMSVSSLVTCEKILLSEQYPDGPTGLGEGK
jgi:hypothetical protein